MNSSTWLYYRVKPPSQKFKSIVKSQAGQNNVSDPTFGWDQVMIPLNTYQGQFPEMRKKIDKRGRKLIDFDKERHNVQQMQSNPNRNEAKFAR